MISTTFFENLIRIDQIAFLQTEWQHNTYRDSGSDDYIPNKVVKILLEARLFRNSKLPVHYWSFDLRSLTDSNIDESPLTVAIYAGNIYVIKLLLENSYDVNEHDVTAIYHIHDDCSYMEHKGTPLTYAIWLGCTEVVTVLVEEAGADVTKSGPHVQTAAETSKLCLSSLSIKECVSCAKITGLDGCDDGMDSRHRIFTMVCANLMLRHGKDYERVVDGTHKSESTVPLFRCAGLLITYKALIEMC